MKTIQMTIEERLLDEVDQLTAALDTSRSAFIRDALQMALRRYRIAALEQQHANGYSALSLDSEDVGEWVGEQVWGRE
jgi:metal-responsive CopG/Arc/MetJ family transcriptional regulator